MNYYKDVLRLIGTPIIIIALSWVIVGMANSIEDQKNEFQYQVVILEGLTPPLDIQAGTLGIVPEQNIAFRVIDIHKENILVEAKANEWIKAGEEIVFMIDGQNVSRKIIMVFSGKKLKIVEENNQ